jgi:hypothetical protein
MRSVELIVLIALGNLVWAQTNPEEPEKHIDVIQSPNGWLKESFEFPLSFAPSIPFSGFEELRFAKEWNDSTSQEFWSYMFVWYLDVDPEMTLEKLETVVKAYYDGLMAVEYTKPEFTKLKDGSFAGRVQTFDQFFTKKDFILNVKMKPTNCDKARKYACLFYISPFAFDTVIWSQLEDIKLKADCD